RRGTLGGHPPAGAGGGERFRVRPAVPAGRRHRRRSFLGAAEPGGEELPVPPWEGVGAARRGHPVSGVTVASVRLVARCRRRIFAPADSLWKAESLNSIAPPSDSAHPVRPVVGSLSMCPSPKAASEKLLSSTTFSGW